MDRDEPPEPSLRPLQGIDTQIGERIRQRRTLLGMSQEALGEALNLSFQQVQKYERGANRVSASRLYEIACIMHMPLEYFYGDLPSPEESGVRERRELTEFEAANDPLARRETLELVRAYYAISDDRVRQRLYALIRSLSSSEYIGHELDPEPSPEPGPEPVQDQDSEPGHEPDPEPEKDPLP